GGVNIITFVNTGTLDTPVVGAPVEQATGQTDENGQVTAAMPPGAYILCVWDEDGIATLPSGDTVTVDGLSTSADDPDAMLADGNCDVFELEAGDPEAFTSYAITNEVAILGDLNGFVFQIVNPEIPEGDVEVCLILAEAYDDAPQPEDFTCVE